MYYLVTDYAPWMIHREQYLTVSLMTLDQITFADDCIFGSKIDFMEIYGMFMGNWIIEDSRPNFRRIVAPRFRPPRGRYNDFYEPQSDSKIHGEIAKGSKIISEYHDLPIAINLTHNQSLYEISVTVGLNTPETFRVELVIPKEYWVNFTTYDYCNYIRLETHSTLLYDAPEETKKKPSDI